jgi:hypothetical protein
MGAQLDFGELQRGLARPRICYAANLEEKETSQMAVMGIKLFDIELADVTMVQESTRNATEKIQVLGAVAF